MKAPFSAPFVVEKPSKMATSSFKMQCKIEIKDILFPILALCFMSWLIVKMSAIPTSQQMRNEIIELKFAPVSTAAAQLVDLQDQLSTRMAQHRDIMSSNLDEFNTILANVTHMADQSVSHLTFLRNLLVVSSGGSNLDWIQAVTLLVDAEEKLRNHTLGDDLRLKLETLTQNAGVMAKEMEDMELFMLDIDNRTNMLMDDLAKALHDEDEEHQAEVSLSKTADNSPQHRGILASFFGGLIFNGNPVNPPAAQSLRWSWDVIVDGNVHPIFGKFTEVQKGLIQCFLTYNNVTTLPTTIPYGTGLPDTLLPQDTPVGPILFIASPLTASLAGSRYSCDITAWFTEQPVKEGWFGWLHEKHETKMERELIGVQSVICWDEVEGEEKKKDVVRERL